MARAEEEKSIVASLDIGTTKVSCVIATLSEESPYGFDVVGVGTAPSLGMRQGVVVNIESTIDAIRKAKEEAELMSGFAIEQAWVGVGGGHIRSFDSKGMVAIRGSEVSDEDIDRVIEAAKAVAVPSDREVIHVLPREYRVDEQEGILDPIGMAGVRLESSVHIVTGSHTTIQNIVKCTEKAGLRVSGLVLQQLASSLPILSEDEKNLGVAVVDIGGGTSDILIYSNGSVSATAMLPLGGSHITNDVAMGLRTPQSDAEELKKKHGVALATTIQEDELIEVPGVGGREPRSVKRRDLCEIIEPRAEEVLNLIRDKIQQTDLDKKLGSGVVLTGGTSQLKSLVELGEYVFDVPVRCGAATNITGLSDIVKQPAFATAIGLIAYGKTQSKGITIVKDEKSSAISGLTSGWTKKIRDLLGSAL